MLTITLKNLCLLGPLTEVHYNAFPIERQDISPYAVLSQNPNQLNFKELDQLSNSLHARTVHLWRTRRIRGWRHASTGSLEWLAVDTADRHQSP
jgi:hypothetical protein